MVTRRSFFAQLAAALALPTLCTSVDVQAIEPVTFHLPAGKGTYICSGWVSGDLDDEFNGSPISIFCGSGEYPR